MKQMSSYMIHVEETVIVLTIIGFLYIELEKVYFVSFFYFIKSAFYLNCFWIRFFICV